MEVDPAHGVDVILVRTNIRKMKIMLEANLYLRYTEGIRIACNIRCVGTYSRKSQRKTYYTRVPQGDPKCTASLG